MNKLFKKENGFTLVEVILATTLLGILGVSLSLFFSAGAESFSLVKSRNEVMELSRAGMNRIIKEIMYIESDDIGMRLPTSFTFLDSEGSSVTYNMGTYQGSPAILRNNDVLIPNAGSISFSYFDQVGNIAMNAEDVRRIQINIVINAEDAQGSITLQSSVYPRAFMYAGFQ